MEGNNNANNTAPNATTLNTLGNVLGASTRTYITRAQRDIIRMALNDFRRILIDVRALDTLAATQTVQRLAEEHNEQYQELFALVDDNGTVVHLEDI